MSSLEFGTQNQWSVAIYIHLYSIHLAPLKPISCGQSSSYLHGRNGRGTVIRKDNKIMLLKHDKRLCTVYKVNNEIWKWWRKGLPDVVATWNKEKNRIMT